MTQTIGSRRQVWNGTSKKTSGGLTKSDLMMSHGRIVSKSKHNSAKKEMRLLKYGYGTKKGKFGFVKIGTKRNKKMRGGMYHLSPLELNAGDGMRGGSGMRALSPEGSASWSGDGLNGTGLTNFGNSSVGLQIQAGMSGGRRRRRKSMRGGTTSQRFQLSPSSLDVQMRAGQGN
jgi:hypothetical protein